jgi:hypothetical protein
MSPRPATRPELRLVTRVAQPAERFVSGSDGPSVLDDLRLSFEVGAESQGETVEYSLHLAGMPVRLRFAGRDLAERLTRAFRHLEAPAESRPELTISIWESAASGAPRPSLAPNPGHVEPRPEPTNPGPSYSRATDDFEALFQPTPDLLSVLSRQGSSAWFWIADSTRLPHWDAATPFRHLLSWWLGARGIQQVHPGAVGTNAGGVLLVGKGGSGKSTTCLSVLGHDYLRYAGDDYVAVSMDAEPWVHSLYSSGKIDPDNIDRLPHLRPIISNADRLDREKAVVFADDLVPGSAVTGFPLRAILIPRIVDRADSRVVPTSPAAAVTALAPSTILQLHPPQAESLGRIRRVAAAVPAFVLELGPDVAAVPDVIRQLFDDLASS